MILIQKFFLLTALRTLQAVEQLLHGLILARPYLPFAAISLVGGFVIGIILTHV
jgi:hypothetical protein